MPLFQILFCNKSLIKYTAGASLISSVFGLKLSPQQRNFFLPFALFKTLLQNILSRLCIDTVQRHQEVSYQSREIYRSE